MHQLDPLDALLYTALVYEICERVENYRIPASQEIACSYRITPDVNGSLFDTNGEGWQQYTRRTHELCKKYRTGVVITCDFVDFYNQIYTHRIRNLIGEAGGRAYEQHGKIIERFLLALNTQTSRGVPVGPAPSIILAELIMADVDKKILNQTRDFVRWVDDIRVFVKSRAEAETMLHDLTDFVHGNHRLVFSGEKTRIISVRRFNELFEDDEAKENERIKAKAQELALEKYYEELTENLGPYDDPDEAFDQDEFQEILEKIAKTGKFDILSKVYAELLEAELEKPFPELALLRRIFRNASRYRIRSILPIALNGFETLVPVVREFVLYLHKVVDEKVVKKYEKQFRNIVDSPRMQIPYINMWIAYLLQNEAFNEVDLPTDEKVILQLRDRALLARRRSDRTWVKGYKNRLDVLGPWEKRAVLYAASVLSQDEAIHWLEIAAARGDAVESAVAKCVISEMKSDT